ncbi:hypothetical protein QJQ45_002169 [Haematococcus lacustris]|nr:hypothetical protein QJQ45_002169 [Haematococcus lacustris]
MVGPAKVTAGVVWGSAPVALSGHVAVRQATIWTPHWCVHKLGQRTQFIQAVLPLVQGALSRLEADSAAVHNPKLPQPLVRAIQRRRMMERKGLGVAGRFAVDEGSMFMAKATKDRRRAHVRAEDEAADAYLASLSQNEESEVEEALAAAKGLPGSQSKTAAFRALFTEDEGVEAFVALCRALVQEGEAQRSLQLAEQAVALCSGVSRWFPRARRDVLTLLLVDAQCGAGQAQASLPALKACLSRWPASCRVWNRFTRVQALTGNARRKWAALVGHARRRTPDSIPAMIMQGHSYAMFRNYTEALAEYWQAFRYWSSEPLLMLCLGCAYLGLASSRKAPDRNQAVLQGFTLLQVSELAGTARCAACGRVQMYERQRGNLHESSYNIGRAAHQLGLSHIAHHYYQRSLAAAPQHDEDDARCSPSDQSPDRWGLGGPPASSLDLSREVAHNLALLYKQSGAIHLAQDVYDRGLFASRCAAEFIRIPSTCQRPAAAVRGVCAGYDAWELAAAGLPLAAQVMGSSPPLLALAAQHLALDKGAPRVDLNCGCPANTVTGHGAGSSLLRSPQLVHDCVRAMVEAAGQHCTVSVKMRSGFTDTSLFAENLLAAQEAGAAFITLHARTKVQKYEGRADWALIARARQLLHIPVIGNGDVVSVGAARALLQQTGCQGLMVGRGAVQDPLLFLRLRDSLRPGAAEQQAGQQRWDEPQLVQAFLRRYAAEACPPRLEVLAESGHHVIKYLFSTNEALAQRCGPLLRMQASDGDTAETLLEIACETIAKYWSTQGPTRYAMVNHMAKPAMSSAV